MLVLGLNGNFSGADTDLVDGMMEYFFHDAAACLIRDGELIAAVEEERLNRIKKTTKFPINAIRACLERANVTPADIDAVGYYFPEETIDQSLNFLYTVNSSAPTRYSRQLIKDWLKRELDWDLPDDKLFYSPHHLAHAQSTFTRSGMSEALVVVMDAAGEDSSGTVYRGDDRRLESLASYSIPNSLGRLYLTATQQLGYGFGDEYKVMGLAPYGDPSAYREIFKSIYTLQEKGNYEIAASNLGLNVVGPTLFDHGILPRRKGEEFTQQHMDIAAGIQEAVETIVLHVLSYWAELTGLRKLAFGGGVAHNSSLNGVVLRSGLFDEVFVHPASHDSGAGEGAALLAAQRLGAAHTPSRLRAADFGPTLGTEKHIESTLQAWSRWVDIEKPDDIVDRAAQLLADGAVLGWAQGGSEFGPRALGNRSIIADPRPKTNQTRINAMVKKRESYRPFAPVTTLDAADTYFEIPTTQGNHDFMSFVLNVRPEHREHLGAVTHIDGTARLQIIHPETNPTFHRLVTQFGNLTGTPVLLNTSFNNNAEPIVQTLQDALTCYLTTELDHLIIENHLITRKPHWTHNLAHATVGFRPTTRLAEHLRIAEGPSMTREIFLDYATGPRASVSPELFAVLEKADGKTTLGELGLTQDLHAELYALWQERFFTLTPA
ncbi:carbamoyltransferase [Amycolatopsis orientalis]|uniref:Carbamoyltransferase n=1 Tax=Amycolatopsis orientalis TaxID=31958 RepID=A0A193CAQ5_AMYOR|nr:carbamoyltransferase C-terminal domain-containing protein [Amycolatopsis orientalis]ANN21701.1 carbamoyltransferase [Amycolatopsis orientalis]